MSWLIKQFEHNTSQFDKSMETYNPGSQRYLRDPRLFLSRIKDECNYLDAVQQVNWSNYLKDKCTVLDLAGGTGWLSAYLSTYDTISQIYLLDSSKFFLQNMMPGIVELMSGNAKKITPIEGLFAPLYFEDKSLDVVVVSSSLHHVDNMETLLKEIKRVLKDDGFLLILNETPYTSLRYVAAITKQFVRIMLNTLLCRYTAISPSISSSGYLYDPYLQDRAYPIWYWVKSLENVDFKIVSLINTGLFTQKSDKKGLPLTHIICIKNNCPL